MSRGSDKNRPLRDMGKRWVKLSLVTTEDSASWLREKARANGTSMTACLDEIVARAKWNERKSTDKIRLV